MDIVGKFKIWFLISAILIIPGIISLSIWKLNMGIDFKGGTITTIEIKSKNNKQIKREVIADALKPLKLSDISVQPVNTNSFIIRTASTDPKLDINISKILNSKIGETDVVSYESIGPSVSHDLTVKAIIAILAASLAIILYLAIAFRKVPKPANSWRFGFCAVFALIHDVIFVVGVFSIFGHFFKYEINSLFITALLTIMGFSVHDTIVVFDRIRENLRLSPSTPFKETINNSIIQTFARSMNTSLTVFIVLLSMFLLGGESIRPFILALLIGIIIGTYSSIFNATPLLYVWQNFIDRRQLKTKSE